jgi:hypothetical protein
MCHVKKLKLRILNIFFQYYVCFAVNYDLKAKAFKHQIK